MGVKLPHKKAHFWANFALLSRIFLVSVFLIPFKGLFDPTFQGLMSKLFRFLESLGKSNEKKRSNKGCKIAAAKKVFYRFCFICSLCLNIFLPHFPKSNVQTFQIFGILWEKKWKEVVSDMKTFAYKWCKYAAQKKFFFWRILPYQQDFLGIRATISIGREMLCLPFAGFFLSFEF